MKKWLYDRFIVNGKSTWGGILTVVVALSAAGFLAPNPYVNTKLSGAFSGLSILAKVILSIMTNDAKKGV